MRALNSCRIKEILSLYFVVCICKYILFLLTCGIAAWGFPSHFTSCYVPLHQRYLLSAYWWGRTERKRNSELLCLSLSVWVIFSVSGGDTTGSNRNKKDSGLSQSLVCLWILLSSSFETHSNWKGKPLRPVSIPTHSKPNRPSLSFCGHGTSVLTGLCMNGAEREKGMHTVPSHTRASLPRQTSLTKHKFKGKIVKFSRCWQQNIKPGRRPSWTWGPVWLLNSFAKEAACLKPGRTLWK